METIVQNQKKDRMMQPRSKGEVDAPGLSPCGQGAAQVQAHDAHIEKYKTKKEVEQKKEKMHSRVELLRGGNVSRFGGITTITPTPRTGVPRAALPSLLTGSELTNVMAGTSSFKRLRPDEADDESVSPQEWQEVLHKREEALSKLESPDPLVEEVMTPKEKVLAVGSTEPMSKVEPILHLVSGAPVLDDCGNVVGVIGRSDLNRCKNKKTEQWRHDPISKHMSQNPKVVRRFCKIWDAVSLLEELGYHRLPVVDEEEKFIGIVTRHDLAKNILLEKKRKEQAQIPKVYTEEEKLEMLRQWKEKYHSAERRMPTSKENWLVDGKEDQPFGIGRWLNRLKSRVLKEYRKDPKASNDGQKLLDGPICEILGLEPGWWKEEERWERKLTELKTYMETYGEIPRKSKDRNLYHFVTKQREKNQRGEMSDWRKKKLEEIPGWGWDDGTVTQDADWEQKYEKLEEFVNANAKCLPTLQNNSVLYWFLEEQRSSHAKDTLTQPRKDKLDALLGMGWWNKEGHYKAQIAKVEDEIKDVGVEEVEKEEICNASPPEVTDPDAEAADTLVMFQSFEKKPAKTEKKTEKKNPHKQPITDPDELKELKDAGMTPAGEKRIMTADSRCRPSAALRNLFEPTFHEFRLPSVLSSARAEDIVNLWARQANLTLSKEVPFNFDKDIYLQDVSLMEDLRMLTPKDGEKADPKPLEEFLKKRFNSRSLSMKRKANETVSEGVGDSKGIEQLDPDEMKKQAASSVAPATDVNASLQKRPRTLMMTAEDRCSFRRPPGENPRHNLPHYPGIVANGTSLPQSIQPVAPKVMATSKEGKAEHPMKYTSVYRSERLKALDIRWHQGHLKSSFQQIPARINAAERNAEYDLEDGKGPRKFNLGMFVDHEIMKYRRQRRTKEEMEELVKSMHLDIDATAKFWNRCKKKEKGVDRSELLAALDTRWKNGHLDPEFREIPVQNSDEANALYDLGDGKGPRKFNLGLSISTEIQSYKKGKRQEEEMEELIQAMHLSEEERKVFWERCKKDNAATESYGYIYPEKRQRKKEKWLVNFERVKEYPLPSEWPTQGPLGTWLRHQKKCYIDNTLASEPGKDGTSKEDKRRLLEALPGWSDHIKTKMGGHSEKLSIERLREIDSRFNTLLRVLEEWKVEQSKVPILKRKCIPAQRDRFIDSKTNEELQIGGWIQNYKKSAKNGVSESIQKLAEIGRLLGIGEKWWRDKGTNTPPGSKEEAQDHLCMRTDQDEDIEIVETPENDVDGGVLPKEDNDYHESTISIPQSIRDNFVEIERDLRADKKNFDYTRLSLFYSDLYSLTKDDVFKWAQRKISDGMEIKNYDDVYMTFYSIKGDFEDNDLGKVIKEIKERSKQKEVKQEN